MEKKELIINKLDLLKREIDFIKENLIDITLTPDDINFIREAEEDLKKGRTKRL